MAHLGGEYIKFAALLGEGTNDLQGIKIQHRLPCCRASGTNALQPKPGLHRPFDKAAVRQAPTRHRGFL
jgi:hypothetical protein